MKKTSRLLSIIEKSNENIFLAKQKQYLTIQDDASNNSVLINAGINLGATSILCATGDDVVNVYITLTSRSLNSKINIISRVNRKENEKKLYQAGASHVIQPFEIAGLLAAEYVGQPVAFEAILGILNGQKQIQMETLIVLSGSMIESHQIGELKLENKKLSLVGVISSKPSAYKASKSL